MKQASFIQILASVLPWTSTCALDRIQLECINQAWLNSRTNEYLSIDSYIVHVTQMGKYLVLLRACLGCLISPQKPLRLQQLLFCGLCPYQYQIGLICCSWCLKNRTRAFFRPTKPYMIVEIYNISLYKYIRMKSFYCILFY